MRMTCFEKFKLDYPKGPLHRYPHNYGYAERPKLCYEMSCRDCWNRTVQKNKGGDEFKNEPR